MAMIAHGMAGDRERYLASGMDDFLSKPLENTALDAIVDGVIKRRVFIAPAAEFSEPLHGPARTRPPVDDSNLALSR